MRNPPFKQLNLLPHQQNRFLLTKEKKAKEIAHGTPLMPGAEHHNTEGIL
jgi:hypothetical protein